MSRDPLSHFAGLDAGTVYFNIHTSTFPGGEMRAFAERVPEPASLLLGAIGIGIGALLPS